MTMIHPLVIALYATAALPTFAFAGAPQIQTTGPIIHLADNLDEQDNLGWCIDTAGRGQSDTLHTHSCKPPTGELLDVNFTYDLASGQIRSAAYDNQCATLNAQGSERRFGLVDCAGDDAAQAFQYDAVSGKITPRGQAAQCLTAGAKSDSAGPYMSRTLELVDCDTAPEKLRRWVVRAK